MISKYTFRSQHPKRGKPMRLIASLARPANEAIPVDDDSVSFEFRRSEKIGLPIECGLLRLDLLP